MGERIYYGWAIDPTVGILESVWLEAYAYAFVVAKSLTRSLARAEDLRAQTFLVIRERRKWDHTLSPFKSHVITTVRYQHLDMCRARARRAGLHVPLRDDAERDDGKELTAFERLIDGAEDEVSWRLARHYLQLAREHALATDDPLAVGLIDLTCDEVDGRAAQAAALGISEEEVRVVRQRIRRYIDKLLEKDQGEVSWQSVQRKKRSKP